MSTDITPDSQHRGLVAGLPQPLRDFALLARFDRPIGFWLLFWPCAWGITLSGAPWQLQWPLLAWTLLGAIAMRGAGCVYNDIVDADLDRQVARTASRPVASGRVSSTAAWAWLVTLAGVGLIVLLQLRAIAQLVALSSLLLVAAYPFMKRITWWPQAWLGLVFTWGAPTGWFALRDDRLEVLAALYAGAFFWCLGYDTIYALLDRADDAAAGIMSSARRLGRHVRSGVAGFYAAAVLCWGAAFWLLRADWLALLALLPVAGQLAWQVATLAPDDPANPLARFRANHWAGLLLALACFVVGNA